tara:strand:- start:97 stop:1146 length:1050 start_codon:yes stop_codon:yes gene_type:complete
MEDNQDNKTLAESMGYKLVDDAEKNESTESVDTESSLQENSDNPESSETKSEPIDFNSLLLEKSEGKFESYEDLVESFEKTQQKQNTSTFANETIAKMNQYVLSGGKIDDFNKTQVDYSEMSDDDIVKSEMKLNDSDLSDEDIDFMFNNEYTLDEEEYDEDEVRISKLKLRKDAKQSREKLVQWKKQFEIPEVSKATENQRENIDSEKLKQQESFKIEKERWANVVHETTSKFDKVDFDINDKGEKFTFALSDEDRNSVKETSADLSKFWSRFMNKDGTENVEKLNKTMFLVDNFDKVVRAVANQYKSNGKDDVLKDIKNPDYSMNNSETGSELKSLQQQMYDAWQKGN